MKPYISLIMALIKCSLCVLSLLIAGAAGAEAKNSVQVGIHGTHAFYSRHSATHVADVVEMIKKIEDEVQSEAVHEDKVYANFARFCKDKTGHLETMLRHHAEKIDLSWSQVAGGAMQTNKFFADRKKRRSTREVLKENREDLAETDGILKQVVTACHSRAAEYSARTAMRTQELKALATAVSCLKDSHTLAKRHVAPTFLQSSPIAQPKVLPKADVIEPPPVPKPDHFLSKSSRERTHIDIDEVNVQQDDSEVTFDVSLEGDLVKANDELKSAKANDELLMKVNSDGAVPVQGPAKSRSLLQDLHARGHEWSSPGRAELSLEEKEELPKQSVGAFLSEGQQNRSLMLMSLAASLADNPSAKACLTTNA